MDLPPIYRCNHSNRQRYAYGSNEGRTLFVMGLNPSGLPDHNLNSTLRNAKAFAKILGFDSYVMINIYPQRTTDPRNLAKRVNLEAHRKNLEQLAELVDDHATIWAAWGSFIDQRPYLYRCLREIEQALAPKNIRWIRYDSLTKEGHPRHPMYKKHEDRFENFDIRTYLET